MMNIFKESEVLLPLSKAQERIWLEWKLMPDNPAYNNPLCYKLIGKLDVMRLTNALQVIIAQQPALRSYFIEQAGIPKQVLVSEIKVELDCYHLMNESNNKKKYLIEEIINQKVRKNFDLNKLPLFRFILIQTNQDEYIFILNIHHIVVDGYSAFLLIRDISTYYNLQIESINNKDERYINQLSTSLPLNYEDAKKFWIQQFQDAHFHIDFYSNNLSSAKNSYQGDRINFSISKKLTREIKQVAKKNKTTDFVILMATFYVVLARITNQYDLTIGYAVDTRTQTSKDLFGFFVNNIPLRLIFNTNDTFTSIILQLTKLRKALKPYQQFDYIDIIKSIRQFYHTAPHALYNVSFIRANFALTGFVISDMQVDSQLLFTNAVKEDLCLLYDENDNFQFIIEYSTGKFEHSYIKLIEQAYVRCLQSIVTYPECHISDINIFENNITYDYEDYRNTDALILRFIHHVKSNPHKIAIQTSQENLTYLSLNKKVHIIINYLRIHQLTNEYPVVVILNRTPNLIATLLALQWLGITYIPLDVSVPLERLNYILKESRAAAVIAESHIELLNYNIIQLDQIGDQVDTMMIPKPVLGNHVYIIYTSGSTGIPKGVIIGYTAFQHFLHCMALQFAHHNDDLFLAITTIAFDIAALELFMPLWAGSSIYLTDQYQHKDPFTIKSLLTTLPITHLQATPAMWQMLIDVGWKASETNHLIALCGGEPLTSKLAKQLLFLVGELWNMYGPTEATIWCAYKKITSQDFITIGKPIQHMQFFVLDQKQRYLPPYIKGELYIGGIGLAEGYLNREELNEERFIIHTETGCKLYRTGDISCQTNDGEFILFGRNDYQIKLNGYRIELGEIETQLLKHPNIYQATVIVNQQQLVAYLLAKDVSKDKINLFLSASLPDYMLPKQYVFLEKMPLTASGKIDRRALSTHEVLIDQLEHPETELESQLLSIWKDILNIPLLSVTDHFYYCGGHSLLAVQLIASIEEKLQVKLTTSDFFKNPSIRQLSSFLEKSLISQKIYMSPSITHIKSPWLPLSLAQKRFWFLLQLENDNGQFNMSACLYIKSRLDVNKIIRSLNDLCHQHLTLLTHFRIQNNDILQSFKTNYELPFQFIKNNDLMKHSDEFIHDWAGQSFKLIDSLLWRACLIQIEESKYLFSICIHHLICDGYSVQILLRDLWKFYSNVKYLNDNSSKKTYLDYVAWEIKQQIPIKKIEFWQNELLRYQYLRLPSDFPKIDQRSSAGDQEKFFLDEGNWHEIMIFCKIHHVSVSSYCIACFALLIYRITQQSDFCIGIPVANREHSEFVNVVGCFVNILPIRINIIHDISFSEWVLHVHKHVERCITLGNIPFSQLLEHISFDREIGPTPLFSIIINIQEDPFNKIYTSSIEFDSKPILTRTSKYDLSMELYFSDKMLNGYCEFATDLFKRATISTWCEQYISFLCQDSNTENIFNNRIHKSTAISNIHLSNDNVQFKCKRQPVDSVEIAVSSIWKSLLNVDDISLDDNFFALGGHSLIAAKMIAILCDYFNKKIPIETIFKSKTLAEFCISIKNIESYGNSPDSTDFIPTVFYLTPNQKQISLLYLQEESDMYHLSVLIEWPFDVDSGRLENIINMILQKHSIYRWQMKTKLQAEFNQYIHASLNRIKTDNAYQTQDQAIQYSAKQFNLYLAPLARFAIIHEANGKNYLLINIHHLIADEWSLQLLVNEIYQNYCSHSKSISYSWTNYLNEINNHETMLQYWENYLNEKNLSVIPYTKNASQHTRSIQTYYFEISREVLNQCRNISIQNNVSLYITILSVYYIHIKYFTGEDKVTIATTYDRRNNNERQYLHGYLVNLLLIHIDFNSIKNLYDILNMINQDRANHIQHADIDFAQLIEHGITNKPEIVFNFQHDHQLNIDNTEHLKWREISSKHAKFSLTLHMRVKHDKVECTFEYDNDKYHAEFIENCALSFQTLLGLLSDNVNKNIADWTLVNKPYSLFQNREFIAPDEGTFISYLYACHQRHNNKIAIDYNGFRITYHQLWENVKQMTFAISHQITESLQDKIIAVCMQNSDDYVTTILSILSLGAAFLPIDVNYPIERQQQMIRDSKAISLITDQNIHLLSSNYHVLPYTTLKSFQLSNVSHIPLSTGMNAYVIYTSGTTGTPKGVMIKQRQLHLFIAALQNKLSINSQDNILQFSSISFDASIWEIFIALYSGSTLYIPTSKQRNIGNALQNYMKLTAITHALLTPSVLSSLDPKSLPSLHCIVSGGESCRSILIDQWSDRKFYNAYGPTEATICTNITNLDKQTKSNLIGAPLGAARLQVYSDTNQILPTGAIGELFISGDIIASDYLNNKLLTEQKFISFYDTIFYKSGDIVRVIFNQQFEYFGRKDRQIKLRGLRVELDEIEIVISTLHGIRQVICSLYQDNIIAYIVSDVSLNINTVQEQLAQKLPHFMVPSHIMQLTDIPLLPSGKIDMNQLPLPHYKSNHILKPQNNIQENIYSIWLKYLHKRELSIDSDFFALGGNSLQAMQISAEIEDTFQINCSLQLFFNYPTVISQSKHIEELMTEFSLEKQSSLLNKHY